MFGRGIWGNVHKRNIGNILFRFQAKDLPSAVNEVLSTNKGTLFYVLTVAGEHGIPPDKPADKENQPGPGTSAFMTEVSGLSEVDTSSRPDYLKSIDVKDAFLIEIKKQ